MARTDINDVNISGNLTKDPELTATSKGTPLCRFRIASNKRRKQGDQWVDKPGFYNVSVFGGQAERCAQYLRKGSQVFVSGSLDHNESGSGTDRKEYIGIEADNVVFGGAPAQTGDMPVGGQTGYPAPAAAPAAAPGAPAFAPVPVAPAPVAGQPAPVQPVPVQPAPVQPAPTAADAAAAAAAMAAAGQPGFDAAPPAFAATSRPADEIPF